MEEPKEYHFILNTIRIIYQGHLQLILKKPMLIFKNYERGAYFKTIRPVIIQTSWALCKEKWSMKEQITKWNMCVCNMIT